MWGSSLSGALSSLQETVAQSSAKLQDTIKNVDTSKLQESMKSGLEAMKNLDGMQENEEVAQDCTRSGVTQAVMGQAQLAGAHHGLSFGGGA